MGARIVLIIAALALVSGCSGGGEGADVVAGFYPLAWAARQVGGPGIRVDDLTPAGAEPHDLEPSARDVQRIRDAKLVLYIRGFQPALERALEERAGPSLDLRAGVPGDDPHIWLDPVRFAGIVRSLGRELGRAQRADALAGRLEALDHDYRVGLARCRRHEIVTSHVAFGFLAARYGLRQVSLAGLSPEAEPTPRALERLVAAVHSTGATTVFREPLASPRIAETVARETGARTAVLDPAEGLTAEQQRRGDDYLSIMRGNLAALRQALGCR